MADDLSLEQREAIQQVVAQEFLKIRRPLADAIETVMELLLAVKAEVTALRGVLMSRGLVTETEMAEALKILSAASAIEWAVGDLRDVEAFLVALARLRGERPGGLADPAPLG